jgi:hypothetical protein
LGKYEKAFAIINELNIYETVGSTSNNLYSEEFEETQEIGKILK